MPPQQGLVVAVDGLQAIVRIDAVDYVATRAGRVRERAVVGDRVDVSIDGDRGRIEAIAPRRTVLRRLQRLGRGAQPLVANADVLVVVVALAAPPLRRGLIDRLLVAADVGGLEAVLCITKADLADQADEPATVVLADYGAIGYEGLAIDARNAADVAAVDRVIGTRSAVVAGHSGVGKSTLVNGLAGDRRETGAVNALTGRGRHTTTSARLIERAGRPPIIDTPGIRGFALPDIDADELMIAFREIRDAPPCRFPDCRHIGEPGCVITARMSPRRLASYRKLLEELTPASRSRT